jgi:hypothetical protein
MEFPADFPHTRREQYLVALSPRLLTDDEVGRAIRITDRLGEWLETRGVLLVCELLRRGWERSDVLDLLPGRPPAALRRLNDGN